MVLHRWVVAALVVGGALAGCSDGDAGAEADERTAEEIVADAAVAMSDVETAAFTIEQSGANLAIDEAGQLIFHMAEGQFAQPASAEALIEVEALGFTTEVGAVAVDGATWFTNPLTGIWAEAPAGFSFDPSALFDADEGFPALLSESAATAELIEADDGSSGTAGSGGGFGAPPSDVHHVRTAVDGSRVAVLTGGLVTAETDVDLWIDPATSRLVEIRFEVPSGSETSLWRLALSDYDAEVTIEPPETGAPAGN